jgi:hypothetical protein
MSAWSKDAPLILQRSASTSTMPENPYKSPEAEGEQASANPSDVGHGLMAHVPIIVAGVLLGMMSLALLFWVVCLLVYALVG